MVYSLSWRNIFLIDTESDRDTLRKKLSGWAEGGSLVCLVILAALLPFAGITVSRELGLHLGLFFWLASMALSGKWQFIRTPLDLPFFLLAVVGVISVFTAVDTAYTLHELRGEMLKGLLIYYLAVNNLRTRERAFIVFGIMALAIYVMDIYGVCFFMFSEHSFIDAWPRLTSFHAGPPQLSAYLIQTAPFIFVSLFWERLKNYRSWIILFSLLHFFTIYLTFSRMALLALMAQVVLVFLVRGMSWKKLLLAALAGLLVMIIFLPRHFVIIGDEAKNETHIGEIAIPGLKGTRLLLWSTAVNHIKEHPFTGLGYGRRSLVKKYPSLTNEHEQLWHSHNTFLSMAVEMGLQGLAVFCFLLYRIVRYLWPIQPNGVVLKEQGLPGLVMIGGLIAVVGYFMINLTNDLYADDNALLFWLLMGFAFSMRNLIFKELKN